jgi:hypothetical protein
MGKLDRPPRRRPSLTTVVLIRSAGPGTSTGPLIGMLTWPPAATTGTAVGVAEPAAQLALQASDRVQVLWRPRVPVLAGRIPAQRGRRLVGESDDLGGRQVGGALDADHPGPGSAGSARQPQVQACRSQEVPIRNTGVRRPGGQPAHHRVQLSRQVGGAVRLDVPDSSRQVGASAQRTVSLGTGGKWLRHGAPWKDGTEWAAGRGR